MPIQLYPLSFCIGEESKCMERKVADIMPCGDSVLQSDHVCIYEGKK